MAFQVILFICNKKEWNMRVFPVSATRFTFLNSKTENWRELDGDKKTYMICEASSVSSQQDKVVDSNSYDIAVCLS